MTVPHSAYLAITFGAGIRVASLAADLSAAVGRESGSGNSLLAGQVALTLTYIFER
jgi:hypothetical protein